MLLTILCTLTPIIRALGALLANNSPDKCLQIILRRCITYGQFRWSFVKQFKVPFIFVHMEIGLDGFLWGFVSWDIILEKNLPTFLNRNTSYPCAEDRLPGPLCHFNDSPCQFLRSYHRLRHIDHEHARAGLPGIV